MEKPDTVIAVFADHNAAEAAVKHCDKPGNDEICKIRGPM